MSTPHPTPPSAPRPTPRPTAGPVPTASGRGRLLAVLGVAVAALVLGGGAYAVTSAGVSDADPVRPSTSGADAASGTRSGTDARVDPATAAVTSFPGLAAATGEPTLPGLAAAAPPPGAVGTVPGPFDDRFTWQALALDGARLTGGLRVTSDVSDLLELQVLAAFYDRSGQLLGTGRFTHHLNEDTHHDAGPPSERETFRITAPRTIRARVASAAVGVPVLVNE